MVMRVLTGSNGKIRDSWHSGAGRTGGSGLPWGRGGLDRHRFPRPRHGRGRDRGAARADRPGAAAASRLPRAADHAAARRSVRGHRCRPRVAPPLGPPRPALVAPPGRNAGDRRPARRRSPPRPPPASLGYLLEDALRRVYFAGDTDLFPGMADLGELDVALLPIWGWGPRLGPGHLDPYRAAAALRLPPPRPAR